MSITYGPNLGIMSGAADGDLYGDAMRAFQRGVDGLVMPNAKGYLTNTPPGTPSDGDLYIIGAAPTGAWAGQGGKVTSYSTAASAWEFFTPKNGWMVQANSARETYRYTGGAWEISYQEGTWTPVMLGGTTAGSPTHTIQNGKYVKSGGSMLVWFTIRITATGGMAGDVNISGLPYSAADGMDYAGAISNALGISTYGSGCTFLSLMAQTGSTRLILRGLGASGGTVNLDSSSLSPTTTLVGSCFYRI